VEARNLDRAALLARPPVREAGQRVEPCAALLPHHLGVDEVDDSCGGEKEHERLDRVCERGNPIATAMVSCLIRVIPAAATRPTYSSSNRVAAVSA